MTNLVGNVGSYVWGEIGIILGDYVGVIMCLEFDVVLKMKEILQI